MMAVSKIKFKLHIAVKKTTFVRIFHTVMYVGGRNKG